VLEALRIRDFRLLWCGGLVSALGSWLLVLALPAHVFLVTGSLRDTGLTIAAEYVPLLALGPVAGVLADRWDRRRLMIWTNLYCAAAVATMLLGTSAGRYWVLYLALIAENCGSVLYSPASQARTPAIVGTGSGLSSANALISFGSGAVRLIGGPLGGILLPFCGINWLICVDVISYLLAATAVFMTSRQGSEQVRRTAARAMAKDVVRDLREGMRVLREQPVALALLPVMLTFLAANAALSSVLIPFGIQRLGGSEQTGFLLSCLGIGFLAGAPLIRPLLDRIQCRSLLTATLAATAAAQLMLFTSHSLGEALPAAVAIGMFGSMSLVIPQTTMQRVVPNVALGRVSAVFLTGEAAVTLAGAVAGPNIAQAAHLPVLAIAASSITLVAAALSYVLVPQAPSLTPVQA
jgi:MFS family permease